MSELITIQVSDQVVRFASSIASRNHQPVAEVLSKLLETTVEDAPVESLSNEEILKLSKMMPEESQDKRLSELLTQQRENQLDEESRIELSHLMQLYEKGLLRKSQALREAVQRGLRAPLEF